MDWSQFHILQYILAAALKRGESFAVLSKKQGEVEMLDSRAFDVRNDVVEYINHIFPGERNSRLRALDRDVQGRQAEAI